MSTLQGATTGGSTRAAPAISVIIPTWNEAPWLSVLLDRLTQCPSIAEVVVADHGSIDDTRDIAKAHGCIVVEGGRPAAGKNAGAKAARSELLLFVDADVAVTPQVVAEILAAFADPSCVLVHLRLVPATERRFIRACYRVVHFYAVLGAKLRAHQGSAPLICVRREAFFAIDGFDERVAAAEDVDRMSPNLAEFGKA
jgi:glycosyltransferase involved in cell wall biosynthesis